MLNFPQYQGASILLARENFGCGSSREHAPWALTDYGFKVVIAPSFADIFYGNSFNNQLLPVKLSDAEVDELFALVKANPGIHFDVDLEAQEVKAGEKTYRFTIDAFPPPLHDERSGTVLGLPCSTTTPLPLMKQNNLRL